MQRTPALYSVVSLLQRRWSQSLPAAEITAIQLERPCSSLLQELLQHALSWPRAGPIAAGAWTCQSVRHMAGRPHKLSLKHANNKASWLAVRPFLEQHPGAAAAAAAAAAPKPQPIETAIPPLPQQQEPLQHRRIGRITGPYAVAPQAAFAVVQTGGAQYKVTADDVIYHNKIPHTQVNDVLELGKVLLVGTQTETVIGRPFIPGASVIAVVEEVLKDAKVHVFKKKKRKGYSTLKGHRSHVTVLRIVELRAPGLQQQLAAHSSTRSAQAASEAAAAAAPVTLLRKSVKDRPPALVALESTAQTSAKSSSSSSRNSGKSNSKKG